MFVIVSLFLAAVSVPVGTGSLSMSLPAGWRRLEVDEARALRPKVKPLTELQRQVEEAPKNTPLLIMKHDTGSGGISASVQVFHRAIPANMRGASSMQMARVVGFGAVAAFRGKYEVEPRETTIDGRPAAEWIAAYTLVEQNGDAHPMRAHIVILAAGVTFYSIGYSGPADDAADFAAFDEIVKSIKLTR